MVSPLRSFLIRAAIVLAASAGLARADYLILDDGRRIDGKILSETAVEVEIETNFGTFKFKKYEIVEIKREKTRDEIYDEKLAAAKTGEDFYQLGLWCEDNKLRRRATKHYEKAIEVEPNHAGARAKLGFVLYKDEWMTPEERDKRAAEDFALEMKAKGLVEHEGEWVTPAEKEKLEQGLMNLDGRWVTREEYMRRKGYGEFEGEMMALEKALALEAAHGFAKGAKGDVRYHVGAEGALIGMLPLEEMRSIAEQLVKTRAWFNKAYGVAPGLKIYDGRVPEFYVFGEEQDAHYPHAVEWSAGRSNYIPEGWKKSVKRTLGFTWLDPVPISAARQGPRGSADLAGHCFHNLGHLMAGRLLNRDGRLLPPWYEEGVASIAELRTHSVNRVFCRSSVYAYQGSRADGERPDIDEGLMRDGDWEHALQKALETGQVQPFDKLARLTFSELSTLDIAQSMAIVAWLETKPGALAKFHRALREVAPELPNRLHLDGNLRQQGYEKAFQAAVGMGFRQADAEWRKWFRSR